MKNRDVSEEMVTTLVNNPELQRRVQEWVSPGDFLDSAGLCQVVTKTLADIRYEIVRECSSIIEARLGCQTKNAHNAYLVRGGVYRQYQLLY